jgi:membrane-associated phospholipid phosphatase
MTMYAIFALAPFTLRTDEELNRLAAAVAQVILISGVSFALLPAELGFPPAIAPGSVWEPWLRTADRINLDFNCIPSLHVALFATCAGTYTRNASSLTRVLLSGWLALVTASTVLTHQHHLIDAATGLALGAWGAKVALNRRNPASGVPGARTMPDLEKVI